MMYIRKKGESDVRIPTTPLWITRHWPNAAPRVYWKRIVNR